MGLAKGSASILLAESARKPFSGEVLTLGKQDVYFSDAAFKKMAARFGATLSPLPAVLSPKPDFAAQGYISDDYLFASLGFSKTHCLDYSDFEGAGIIHDLNAPEAPASLRERYDLVVDGGTLEHVFHIPNALNNIFQMLKVGGRVVHILPTTNMVDHGFYMFSPTLLLDFYGANNYQVEYIRLIKHTLDQTKPWIIYNYTLGCLDNISLGGLDSGMYSVCCVATKTEKSTGNLVPQQRCYQNGAWIGVPQYMDTTKEDEKSPQSGSLVAKKLLRLRQSLKKKFKGVKMVPMIRY
ncbi:MAG TPA: hypothetical protein DDZ88_00035 [Verrucomicrobiales bacterium]|nr:hypothetical protein [Verrucomicrobiales bacterium]